MASLDWAAAADDLSREALVLIYEMPGGFDNIEKLYDSAKCAAEAGKKIAEDVKKQAEDAADGAIPGVGGDGGNGGNGGSGGNGGNEGI